MGAGWCHRVMPFRAGRGAAGSALAIAFSSTSAKGLCFMPGSERAGDAHACCKKGWRSAPPACCMDGQEDAAPAVVVAKRAALAPPFLVSALPEISLALD